MPGYPGDTTSQYPRHLFTSTSQSHTIKPQSSIIIESHTELCFLDHTTSNLHKSISSRMKKPLKYTIVLPHFSRL